METIHILTLHLLTIMGRLNLGTFFGKQKRFFFPTILYMKPTVYFCMRYSIKLGTHGPKIV